MIYDILHSVEKHIPQNMSETRSKILMPSYRFVTSANFVFGVIVIGLLLALILLPKAYGYEQQVIDRNGIKNLVATDLKHNTTSVVFDFCHNKYTLDSVGVLLTSNLDVVPVPVALDSIKYGKCAIYGETVLGKPDTISATLFEDSRINALISSFNAKVHELKNSLALVEQKINTYKKIGYGDEKIGPLDEQAKLLEKQLKSAQSGLKTLIAMKNS